MTDVSAKRGPQILRRFLLQDAESLARRLSEPERRQLRDQIARARQKVESAKVLWSSEQYVEGLRLAEEGIAESLRAVELAGAAWPEDGLGGGAMGEPPPDADGGEGARWERVLQRLGASSEELSQVRAAQSGAAGGGPPPKLNEEISPQHRRWCRTAVWLSETALGRIGRLAAPPSRIVISRFLRIGSLVAIVVIAVGSLLAMRGRVSVRASGQFPDSRFAASHVNDGNLKTEWILPSRTAGSIEVSFSKRDIAAVKLHNSLNPPHNDRSAKDLRIECLRGEQVIHTAKQTLPQTTTPQWVRVAMPCKDVGGVRVFVDTWHGNGGGLAELAWE